MVNQKVFCILLLMFLIETVSDRGLRNSSWQGASFTSVVSRSFKHHAGDSTIWLGSNSQEEHPGGWSGASHLFPPTSRENLRYNEYSEWPKALYIYKHLFLSRESSAVSIADHSTG
ncbi:hypothetical protein TNCV_730331 [Trichonephila clavipes]|nr:hypothetical protein TNCV_730331 [Trichonephila clavipes]